MQPLVEPSTDAAASAGGGGGEEQDAPRRGSLSSEVAGPSRLPPRASTSDKGSRTTSGSAAAIDQDAVLEQDEEVDSGLEPVVGRRYTVLKKTRLRAHMRLDSSGKGHLEKGKVVEILERTLEPQSMRLRLRTARGWISATYRSGGAFLAEVEEEEDEEKEEKKEDPGACPGEEEEELLLERIARSGAAELTAGPQPEPAMVAGPARTPEEEWADSAPPPPDPPAAEQELTEPAPPPPGPPAAEEGWDQYEEEEPTRPPPPQIESTQPAWGQVQMQQKQFQPQPQPQPQALAQFRAIPPTAQGFKSVL